MGHSEETITDRRGQPAPYVSYWAQRERARRASIFRLAERGLIPAAIAVELGLSDEEVAVVLRADRRRRTAS